MKQLAVTSSAFAEGGMIPPKYTCDGSNINPPLHVAHIPDGAKSLALIVDDPDAPAGTWLHWMMWNIPVSERIDENSAPGTQGRNDFGETGYGGPCPPSGTHRYFFRVFALDTLLDLPGSSVRTDLERTMKGSVLAKGELQGTYRRR